MTIVYFFLILLALVLVHEFGHFKAARMMGVKVREFGFFMPPRIFGWRKKTLENGKTKYEFIKGPKDPGESEHTLFSLNWLPLGGFVNMKGEAEVEAGDDSFVNKKPWQRAFILLSGVSMNLLLGFFLLFIIFNMGIPTPLPEGSPLKEGEVLKSEIRIVSVQPDSPAQKAGLQTNDTIRSLDGAVFTTVPELRDYIQQHSENPIVFEITRNTTPLSLPITPHILEGQGDKPMVGIAMVRFGTVRYGPTMAFIRAAETTVASFGMIFVGLFSLIKQLFQGVDVSGQVAGPVGIVMLTGQAAELGFVYILQFAALLSINLAAVNLLPIPALDGGHILFVIIEKLRRKKNNERTKQIATMIGFSALILLILVITYNDITNIWGSLFDRIKDVF